MRKAPFGMTREAQQQLLRMLEEFELQYERVPTPAFVWIDAALNQGRVESGIAVAYYTDRNEIANDILAVDDLEIVLAVSDEDLVRFVGKTIDFKNGQFMFS
jgi:hypothetical protein